MDGALKLENKLDDSRICKMRWEKRGLAYVAMHKSGGRKGTNSAAKGSPETRKWTKPGQQQLHENSISTHLVVYFLRCVLQSDSLLEDVTLLGQLLALRPVVESACDEHFFGGMLPRSENSPNVSSAQLSVS